MPLHIDVDIFFRDGRITPQKLMYSISLTAEDFAEVKGGYISNDMFQIQKNQIMKRFNLRYVV